MNLRPNMNEDEDDIMFITGSFKNKINAKTRAKSTH